MGEGHRARIQPDHLNGRETAFRVLLPAGGEAAAKVARATAQVQNADGLLLLLAILAPFRPLLVEEDPLHGVRRE